MDGWMDGYAPVNGVASAVSTNVVPSPPVPAIEAPNGPKIENSGSNIDTAPPDADTVVDTAVSVVVDDAAVSVVDVVVVVVDVVCARAPNSC